jgi:hypothetical protein
MSTSIEVPIKPTTQAATTAADPAPVPTLPGPEEIVQQLRLFRGLIPEFAPLTAREKQDLTHAANVAPGFRQASINGIGASPALQSTLGITSEALQQDADLTARWSAVEDELKTLLAGVSALVRTRRHRIGLATLQAYGISKQLVRQKEHAALIPHVAEMKRTKRTLRRAKAPKPTPGPVATTPAPSSTSAPPATTPAITKT